MRGSAATADDYSGFSGIRVWATFTGGYRVETWIHGSIWCDDHAEDSESALWYAWDLLTYYWAIPAGASARHAKNALFSDAATFRWREDLQRFEYLHIPKYPLQSQMMHGAHPYPRAVRP